MAGAKTSHSPCTDGHVLVQRQGMSYCTWQWDGTNAWLSVPIPVDMAELWIRPQQGTTGSCTSTAAAAAGLEMFLAAPGLGQELSLFPHPFLVTSTQEFGNQRDCSVHVSKGMEL